MLRTSLCSNVHTIPYRKITVWGHAGCHWLSHLNPDLVTQMKDVSNEQCQILIIHINDALGAKASTDEKPLQIEFPVAAKLKIFEQPIQSKLQRSVERWPISSLSRNFRESDKSRQCSVWVWTMSGNCWYNKWVSCKFSYFERVAHFGGLSILFWRGQKCFWSTQRSLKEPWILDKQPDQPVRDPSLCKQSKTM